MPSPTFPFIVGCGRSGTTLLRAMCDAHPDLAVPPESHVIVRYAEWAERDYSPAGLVDRLVDDDRFALFEMDHATLEATVAPATRYPDAVRAVFAAWAARHGKPRYADKTPAYVLHVDLLARLFAESVFVHLIRDGRDVASSFVDLGWADSEEDAAMHWELRVRRGRRSGQALGPDRYLEIRYENLVADPETELRKVCALMQLPFSARMLDHTVVAGEVVRTTSHPEYHGHLEEPASSGLRDWRRDMDADVVTRIELLAGDTLADFGYDLSGRRPSLGSRLDVLGRRASWQAHRLAKRLNR